LIENHSDSENPTDNAISLSLRSAAW
jgi:hypothetical protein